MQDPEILASDVLQAAATVAGIALALATLTEGDGPKLGDVRVLPVSLLLVALLAILGSLYAMREILWDAGLSPWELPWMTQPDPAAPYTREALLLTNWSLRALLLVYTVLLFANAA